MVLRVYLLLALFLEVLGVEQGLVECSVSALTSLLSFQLLKIVKFHPLQFLIAPGVLLHLCISSFPNFVRLLLKC